VLDVEYVHVASFHGDKDLNEVVFPRAGVPFAYEEGDRRAETDRGLACVVARIDQGGPEGLAQRLQYMRFGESGKNGNGKHGTLSQASCVMPMQQQGAIHDDGSDGDGEPQDGEDSDRRS